MRANGGSVLFVLTAFLAALSAAAVAGPAGGSVRCAYFYAHQPPEHLQALADHGFSLGIVKMSLDPADPPVDYARLDKVRRFAAAATTSGIEFMPVLNWAGSHEVRFLKGSERRLVTADGRRLAKTPCPNDPRHWKYVFEARALAVADQHPGAIRGMLLDPEMYSAEVGMYPRSGCYCNSCWRRFIADTNVKLPVDLPRERRAKETQKAGKNALYRAHQQQALTSLLTKTRQRIRAEYPDFTLGFLHYANTPFYHGLAHGLGTPQRPVWIFTESTYATGYSEARVDRTMAQLEAIGAHTLFFPGLWIAKWLPDELAAQAYHCAKNASGYWLFTTYSLGAAPESLSGPYQIPAPQEGYWAALRRANRELDRLAQDPDYESPLKLPEPKTIYPRVDVGDLQVAKLAPLEPDRSGRQSADRPTSRLRRRSVVYLYGPTDESARINLTCRQLGDYRDGLSWIVIGPQGRTLTEGRVDIGKTEKVEVALPLRQTCALIADAGSNTFEVTAAGCAVTYSTDPALRLCGGAAPALYFYVPASAREFVVNMRTGNERETATCQVISPRGQIAAAVSGGFPMPHEVRVQVTPGDAGKTWRLAVSKAPEGVFEDVSISFGPGIPPYVAEVAEDLLLPAGIAELDE